MNMDVELAAWRTDWLADQPSDAAMLRLDLRRLVERKRRRMALALFGHFVFGVALLVFSAWFASRRPTVEWILWAAVIWTGAFAAGGFIIWNYVRNMESVVTIERRLPRSFPQTLSPRITRHPHRPLVPRGATGHRGSLAVVGFRAAPSPPARLFVRCRCDGLTRRRLPGMVRPPRAPQPQGPGAVRAVRKRIRAIGSDSTLPGHTTASGRNSPKSGNRRKS